MATLKGDSHIGRADAGDAVLEAAKTTDAKPVAAKLRSFGQAHAAFGKASGAVEAAEAKLRAAQAKVAEADVTQDECVEALATALVGDGQPRTQPFKGLCPQSPSRVKDLGYAAEAAVVRALVAKLRSRKRKPSPEVARACADAERAAKAVDAALAPVAKLEKVVAAARTQRDAFALPWEKAFSALKRAARAAADDGATGLYDTLFKATATPAKPRAKKPAAKPPTPPA